MRSNLKDAIAKRAYEIWEQEGRPQNRQMDHWLLAERELNAREARPVAAAASRPAQTTDRTEAKRRRA